MNYPAVPLCVPEDVLSVLARLASEAYQLRWITNATSEDYVLASDLLNEVEAISRWAATANTVPVVLAVVHRFLAEYYECIAIVPRSINIRQDPAWLRLRLVAERTLKELGHTIPANLM